VIVQHGESRTCHASEGVLMQAVLELVRSSECARSRLMRSSRRNRAIEPHGRVATARRRSQQHRTVV
jgi:hypothetical protein